MVRGLESFREHFKGYEDCYTVIGGTACDILMSEAALPFRATKDIDMILLLENRLEDFAELFWKYIEVGEYKCGWKSSDVPHFYRFTEPKFGYPAMIELFSRRPDFQAERTDIHLTPLPISDEISSLSAIMLDDDYYQLMLSGRRTVDGISVLGAEHIILFKMRAWLDLTRRKLEGLHINSQDLTKHKRDVFRLYAIVDPRFRIALPGKIANDVTTFIEAMRVEEIDMRGLGLGTVTAKDVLDGLRRMYIGE